MASKTKGWRASTGTCSKPGAIEVTTNGGRSWQEVRKSGLSVITSLEAQDFDTVVATGGDKECAVGSAISNNSGEDWNRSDMAESTWYLTPRNREVVRAPGGDRSEPCEREAIALAASTERRAAVLCEDGSLHTSKNAGSTWRATEDTAGVAIGGDKDGYVVANQQGQCLGITVTRFDEEGRAESGNSVSCAPATRTDPKRLAIARFRGTVWLWHDETVTVSRDGHRSLEHSVAAPPDAGGVNRQVDGASALTRGAQRPTADSVNRPQPSQLGSALRSQSEAPWSTPLPAGSTGPDF